MQKAYKLIKRFGFRPKDMSSVERYELDMILDCAIKEKLSTEDIKWIGKWFSGTSTDVKITKCVYNAITGEELFIHELYERYKGKVTKESLRGYMRRLKPLDENNFWSFYRNAKPIHFLDKFVFKRNKVDYSKQIEQILMKLQKEETKNV